MWENFIFSCNAIVPIFAMVGFGYFLKEKKYLDQPTIKKLNNIVFKFALPAMLFLKIGTSDVRSTFDGPFLLWLIIVTLCTYSFSWIFGELFIKDKSSIGAFVQGTFRGNYSILGLSVIASILGDLDTGKGILVTTFIVPLYNILSVLVLSVRNGNEKKAENKSELLLGALKEVVTNPLILGIVAGIPFSYFRIEIPVMALDSIDNLGSLTMPLALMCIGGNIDLKTSFTGIKLAVIGTFFKQILYPVTAILIAVFALNMRGEELVVTFVLTATPTAVSSYVMALNMNSDPKLASNLILFTTMVSLFTFTAGIYILKTFGLI